MKLVQRILSGGYLPPKSFIIYLFLPAKMCEINDVAIVLKSLETHGLEHSASPGSGRSKG